MVTAEKKSSKAATRLRKLGFLDWTFVGILLVVFGGIVLHAPFSVGFGVVFPEYDLVIKSKKRLASAPQPTSGVW